MTVSDSSNTLAVRIRTKIDEMDAISNVSIEGAWIVLEIQWGEFLLSQVAYLVEQNNARMVNFFTYADEETAKTYIGFRIDLEDASNVMRSLERFNYPVVFCFQKHGLTDETMKNRLNELIYYLEM